MKKPISLFYFDCKNFGDAINPYLFQKITGRPVKLWKKLIHENVVGIGSIANWATSQSTIIGAGLANKTDTIDSECKIKLLRGPISGDIARACGNKSNFCFGDPVLILPKLYHFVRTPKHEYGIVPHYVEYEEVKRRVVESGLNIKVIDITLPVFDFIQEVLSCNNIFSSSLHGLILSDALGIPNIQFNFSDKILGDGTKFSDYYLSVGREEKAYPLDEILACKEEKIYKAFVPVNISFDGDKILKAFKCLDEQPNMFVPWR